MTNASAEDASGRKSPASRPTVSNSPPIANPPEISPWLASPPKWLGI